MATTRWSVGELAEATGLTVRPLHTMTGSASWWRPNAIPPAIGCTGPPTSSLSGARKTLDEIAEPPAEVVLDLIERTIVFEQHYTAEQREQIRRRGEQLGPDAIKAVEQEWRELIARVDAAMSGGVAVSDPNVQAMAQRWRELVKMFTGGDPGITAGLGRLWREQGDSLRAQHGGHSGDAFAYIQQAWDAAGD